MYLSGDIVTDFYFPFVLDHTAAIVSGLWIIGSASIVALSPVTKSRSLARELNKPIRFTASSKSPFGETL